MKNFLKLSALTMTLLILPIMGFARVEVCKRPAKIIAGLVDHYWLKTDTKTAGMGSLKMTDKQIGDAFEAPVITKVYVADHTNQKALSCEEVENIDEDCVNSMLIIGQPLGRFSVVNNCQTFVNDIINRCTYSSYTINVSTEGE